MSPKELTKLTVADLFEEFSRDFWNCWNESNASDDTLKGLRNRLAGEAFIEVDLGEMAGGYGPYERASGYRDSREGRSLDADIAIYHARRLDHRYECLLMDGTTLRIRTSFGVRKKVLLAVDGIRTDGGMERIDFRIMNWDREEGAWEDFLYHLFNRGLTGEGLRGVILGENPELISAVDKVYPHVKRQRRWADKLSAMGEMERTFREVRRRTGPRSCFNSAQGLERIVYAVMSHSGAVSY